MEIAGIIIFVIIVLIYIFNKRGQAKWRRVIAEFLLYYPISDTINLIKEFVPLTPEDDDSQSKLAGVYIHLIISALADSRRTGVNNRDNIFAIIKNSLFLSQLFYSHYVSVVAEIKMENISDTPLEYFKFMEKANEVRANLRAI